MKQRKTLGEGGFGCVVAPPLLCAEGHAETNVLLARNPAMYVSKLFGTKHEAVRESEMNEIMKSIDPEGRFSITLVDTCTTAVLDRKTLGDVCPGTASAAFRKIPYGSPAQASFAQIVYPNGGSTLETNLRKSKLPGMHSFSDRDLVLSLSRIITEGLPKMAAAGFMHTDIKADNIMMPERTVAKLIDFGTSATSDNATNPESDLYGNHQVRFPPELYYMQMGMRKDVPEQLAALSILDHGDQFNLDLKTMRDVSGKAYTEIYRALFADTYDLYSTAWTVAHIVYTKRKVLNKRTQFTRLEYSKLMMWLRHILTEDAFARWTPDISAVFWPVIWIAAVTIDDADDLAVVLTARVRERMAEVIRTKIFGGGTYGAHGTSGSKDFEGAVGYARGGKRRTARRSRSTSKRRSRVRSTSRKTRHRK